MSTPSISHLLQSPQSPHSPLSRRQWLSSIGTSMGSLAAVALAPGWAVAANAAAQRWQHNAFALGVASGSPRPDGMVLWSRLLPEGFVPGVAEAASTAGAAQARAGWGAVPVLWEVAHDEAFARVVQSGQALALPELGHSVHVELQGLAADRWYFYRFRVGAVTSPTGRTRTLPAEGQSLQAGSRWRMAYASCQRWEHGHYGAWRHMQDEQLDMVAFVGDYIYESTRRPGDVRSHSLALPQTLDDYRDRYALYKSDPQLQAMHAQCPWLLTWDDHEVLNNYAADFAPGKLDPAAAQAFAAQRQAAYQAYYENQPLPLSSWLGAGKGLQLYQRQRCGALLDWHVLDTRQYRAAPACSGPDGKKGSTKASACAELTDPSRSLLGTAQEQWLAQGLQQSQKSGARWTVLVQTTRFGPNAMGGVTPHTSVSNDNWDGYPAARQRLLQTLQDSRAPNPVLLGGDVHSNWVGHALADYRQPMGPRNPALAVEFTGTSISSNYGGAAHVPQQVADNPHWVLGEGSLRGYGVVEFGAKQLTTTLRVLDDVTQPDSGVRTLARLAVEAGSNRVQQA
ncbi:alkaline phosphatase D family protein [Curvibacter sp. CHRR-16]|uniref:alkaline phosphatase D family protein n=1 Tax=Curvibacter sp. CHRR-16 TaxID=2835872 RepID=UPI001BD9CE5B|nr:alkaline phosphatase D family protein [Curvibacter sp. CHRR-16]MBT0570752.1 alkaline phosphatase D family protein [Curvibacter sp. CHRR-16]